MKWVHILAVIMAMALVIGLTSNVEAVALAEAEVISLQSCLAEDPDLMEASSSAANSVEGDDKYVFMPDFTALCAIDGKTNVNGFVSAIFAFINKGAQGDNKGIQSDNKGVQGDNQGASAESFIAPNAATTQYQGHYIWKVDELVSGFGTYTAAKTSRAFGWIFYNDTGKVLKLMELEFTYGQWGARNSQVDTLAYEWQVFRPASANASADADDNSVADGAVADGVVADGADIRWRTEGWVHSLVDDFDSPYTTASADAVFPIFRRHLAVSCPARLPVGAYFAVRFTDSCPATGSNAHLGLAAFRLALQSSSRGGLIFSVR